GLSIPELFEKLRLVKKGQLKRAAIILFGKDPAKFYPNAHVKIGRFGKDDADLIFQEKEEANLITLYQSVLQQIHHKFIIKKVSFEGMKRIETPEYPIAALREVILNALVHRNYMGAPVQIRVYDDKIIFWNEGTLPQGLSLETLKGFHASQPRNTLIADVCFKGGLIDTWGRGIQKIYSACKEAGLPEPEIKEFQNGLLVTLFKNNLTTEQLTKLGLNERQIRAILHIQENGEITNSVYQQINEIGRTTATEELKWLTDNGFITQIGNVGRGTK